MRQPERLHGKALAAAWVLAAGSLLTGCSGAPEQRVDAATGTGAVASTTASASAVPPSAGPTTLPPQRQASEPVARPVQVSLPSVGITSGLSELGLTPQGELEAPAEWNVAGWYSAGPAPGERGPAVIAGHVDSPDGPAVFWRLKDVAIGDLVEVGRADGSTARFRVTRTMSVPQDQFPTAEVYGPTPAAELRLITCDGPYDRAAGRYQHNLVVFATAVEG